MNISDDIILQTPNHTSLCAKANVFVIPFCCFSFEFLSLYPYSVLLSLKTMVMIVESSNFFFTSGYLRSSIMGKDYIVRYISRGFTCMYYFCSVCVCVIF